MKLPIDQIKLNPNNPRLIKDDKFKKLVQSIKNFPEMADENTTQQVPPNPTGKGGFGDHPENRNPGGWKKENTISYQYHRFLNMTPEQLQEWAKTPNNERTVAMDLAYNRVLEARKSLPDIKEITDRTEGKPLQKVTAEITNNPAREVLEAAGLMEGENDGEALTDTGRTSESQTQV